MLKLIKQFITSNLGRLSSQLSVFESNVAAETQSIRDSYIPSLEQRAVTVTTANSVTATLLVGQIALCDSNLGSITVVLSAPPNQSPGWLAVTKRIAANNVTVVPSGLTPNRVVRRINATTSKVYAAVGVFWIYFDGSEWWA